MTALLHPIYRLQIGSSSVEHDTSEDVIDINVRVGMDTAPGHFETKINLKEDSVAVDKNETVTVSLGYDNDGKKDLTDVFVGKVESINTMDSKVMVLSPLTKLYNLRIDRFYDNQSAGVIVKDLAKEAGVETEIVSDGLNLPSFVVSGNKSAFESIMELAQICGFDFYSTNKSKIVFKKHAAKEPVILEYGKNIIEIGKVDQSPPVDSVKVYGSSPADSKGADKHYWLTKKNIEGVAGSGKNQVLVQNKALKDKDSAKSAAEAILKRMKSVIVINVKTIGNAKIMLGDMVRIQNVPEKILNGDFQVREIEHLLSKTEGFTTSLVCRESPK
jgi:phage protein D